MSAHQLAAVLGQVPSGLFVLSARRGSDEIGMLASWIMQAGFEPPTITVALARERPLADWLAEGSEFVVSLLAAEQKSLVRHFGRGRQPSESPFQQIAVERVDGDIPVPAGAVGYLYCRPISHVESADHRIFLAEVLSGRTGDGVEPMVHLRRSGLKY